MMWILSAPLFVMAVVLILMWIDRRNAKKQAH